MNFDLDEDQSLFKATVERFVQGCDVQARLRARKLPGGLDRARWSEMAEAGLIAMAAAEADGGLGASETDCALVAQALGQGLAMEPWLECGFLPARLLAGSPHLEGVIDGSVLAAVAFAETGRRYALDAKHVQAHAGAGGTVLRGEKTFVLSGGAAELFIVSANLDGATVLYAVPRDTAGLDIKPYPIVDGSLAATITFRDVAVGEPLAASLASCIDEAMVMAIAEMVGTAHRLFDDTLAYVKAREQFGQPIGRFQVIQHRMVDAYSRVEQMQSALYRVLLVPEKERLAHICGIKALVSDDAIWTAQQAVQLHGGMGTTDDLGIGHGLKRILLLSKLFADPASAMAAYAKVA
ncbi:acyl-CoA dehydrogenase family protein [Novosphingobium sp. Chol11]|uniref:acyl-CoA dehydrogenase family protein n=1 Tax=Novosphingobium sp. Chol11 TaxID=1385763 RepID=UPI0025DC3B60|nr:acyl-CoA dehydrogenase family protein [Novosphingobium sp. Chol11]